jgi:cation transport ATPase
MRQECVTAPQLASSFSLLEAVVRLSRHGVIVRDGASIESILTMDALVVPVDGASVSQDTLDALRSAFPGKIILVAKSGEDGLNDSSAAAYGQGCLNVSGAMERTRIVRRLKRDGMRVAYVGVTPDDSAALDEADIAVSGHGSSGSAPPPIQLESSDIRKVVILLDAARAHAKAISEAVELTASLNLIGQGGAFVAGFTPLFNVALTSLGVLLVLKLWSQRMEDLEE